MEDFEPIGLQYLHLKIVPKHLAPQVGYFIQKEPGFNVTDQKLVSPESELDTEGFQIIPWYQGRPQNTLQHILWALENEHINLQILKIVFEKCAGTLRHEIVLVESSTRASGSFRRLWFWFEFFTQQTLILDDTTEDVEALLLLDPEHYVVGPCRELTKRQRVYNNMIGNIHFFPMARRTSFIQASNRCSKTKPLSTCTAPFTVAQIKQATDVLRKKEVRATFEIEGELDRKEEMRLWLERLVSINSLALDTEPGALQLSRVLLQEDLPSWGNHEIFVGSLEIERAGYGNSQRTVVHHIGAAHADLTHLMNGYFALVRDAVNYAASVEEGFEDDLLKLNRRSFDAIAISAILTIAFTQIHPLKDGNGRFHRLMAHYLLHRMRVVPNNMVLPMSIVILRDHQTTKEKTKMLEAYSKVILSKTVYHWESGSLKLDSRTDLYFQSWDATPAIEYFYKLLDDSLRAFKEQLAFIAACDETDAADTETQSKDRMLFLQRSFEHMSLLPQSTEPSLWYSKNTHRKMMHKGWSASDLEKIEDSLCKWYPHASSDCCSIPSGTNCLQIHRHCSFLRYRAA